jgi:hypothetical protein
MPGSLIQFSQFETGGIYMVPGTKGCVLYGMIHTFFERNHALGLPVIGNIARAGGEAAYFERGVIFMPKDFPGVTLPVIGNFEFPLMGQPVIVDLASREIGFLVRWNELKREPFNALIASRAGVFAEIIQGMFSVAERGSCSASSG